MKHFYIFILILSYLPFAFAQVKQNDLTQVNPQIAVSQAPGGMNTGTINGQYQTKDYKLLNMPGWNHKAAPIQNQKSSLQSKTSGQFATNNEFMSKLLEYQSIDNKMFRGNDKQAKLPNLNELKEMITASKFRDRELYEYPNQTDEYVQKFVDKLSLQDVNRYFFRSGRSTEAGLPVQAAGSGEDSALPISVNKTEAKTIQMTPLNP